jgi:endogenous inhibitor of DNA gyrase (YacG/DUF329 family)
MPRWIIECPKCQKQFTHSEISKTIGGAIHDPFAFPSRPITPEDAELKCPHCNESSRYKFFDLRYQRDLTV